MRGAEGYFATICRTLPLLLVLCAPAMESRAAEPTLLRTPNDGIQPQAAIDGKGVLHLIYFKGREGGGYNNQSQNQGRRGGGFPGGRGGGYPGGGGGYPGGGRGGGQRPQGNESHVDGKKILARMADETGGRLFEVTKKETVADIYKEIGDELRATYRLGYSPDDKTASEGYHQIDLSLTKSSPKDLIIQTRDGYYTGN